MYLHAKIIKIQLTLVISNTDNSKRCLSQSKCLIILLRVFLQVHSCYLKLLLSQSPNSGPLKFEITRVHCILSGVKVITILTN